MTLDVSTRQTCAHWLALGDLQGLAERAFAAAAAGARRDVREGAEVSVLVCADAEIRARNASFRGIDKATNVLSFPAPPHPHFAALGDVAIAHETCAREAADEGKTLADHATHLLVHGFLHLLGYDHESDAEAEAMEARERAALAALGIADPYAGAPRAAARA